LIAALLLSAWGALVVQDARGLRALLQTAGTHAASLSPESVGRMLRDVVGVDLLAEQPEWGLAPRGARTLFFTENGVGLAAPLKNAKSARRAMNAWRKDAPNRAAAISRGRVLLASGRGAASLISSMKRGKPLPARGPLWLSLGLDGPLRSAALTLDASAAVLIARGLVVPTRKAALLSGSPPGPCPGSCLRAGLGPAGRDVLAFALRHAGRPVPENAARFSARIDGFDLRQLTDERSIPRAVLWSMPADPPAGPGPALAGQLDLAEIDRELAKLTPLDALRGSAAAGAYAAHLLYGSLLRNAGPLTVSGSPAGNAARIEMRLPITSR
jgi:hypothetical protein